MPARIRSITMILLFVLGILIVAACAPSPTTVDASKATAGNQPPGFKDPFAYCDVAGTLDQPDARYTGPEKPEAVLKGLIKASGASADIPLDVFGKGTVWRCMDKQVYACFVGANLPCASKANTSTEPTAEMLDFCKSNPTSEFIPAAVTGHDTIYEWACKDGKAAVGKQVFQVDGQGYIQNIWYKIAP